MNMTSVDRRKDTLRALDKKPDANAHIFVSSLGLARLCCLLSDIFCGVAWGGVVVVVIMRQKNVVDR